MKIKTKFLAVIASAHEVPFASPVSIIFPSIKSSITVTFSKTAWILRCTATLTVIVSATTSLTYKGMCNMRLSLGPRTLVGPCWLVDKLACFRKLVQSVLGQRKALERRFLQNSSSKTQLLYWIQLVTLNIIKEAGTMFIQCRTLSNLSSMS